jgi:eukaryotic-like serine/threonine-protein kinase
MPTVVCHHCSEIFTVDGPKPDQCPSCGRTLHIEGDPTPTGPALHSTILQFGERKPTAFGRYVVQSRLGAGGFGTVFLAKDPQLDRPVAIKVPRGETGRSPLGLERFAREARNIAQLRHPGIVSVFNVELDGELPFIVCEYVEGETLSDHMRKAPLSFREAARLIADVATAVDYAHGCGIIHRDIKPSNIMIASDGKPRLMDFGLAKREAIDNTVTSDHAILGTPAYMSPEQAWGGKRGPIDRRSDIYSLGTVLYQLLTRELPFHGEPRMVLRQVIEDDPKNPRSLNADIPRDLETICEKALQKEPAGRYQTAGALADDLNRWLRGEPIEARPVTRLERSVRWCRRNPITTGLVATIAGLLVIGFCSATVMFAKERRSRMTLEEALLDNNRLLSKAYVEHANRYMDPVGPVDEYSPLKGLPWLLAAHQIDESDPGQRDASRLRLTSALKMVPSVEQIWLHPGKISAAAAAPTGNLFFTGGLDGAGRIWKYSADNAESRPLTHPAAVTAAQFSPDSKLLLTGCADGAARLWGTDSDKLVAGPLRNAKLALGTSDRREINNVGFSRDGSLFATCRVSTVQIWETATQQPVGTPIELGAPLRTIEFANADSLFVAACSDGSTTLWEARTGKLRNRFQVVPRAFGSAAISPDGTILAGMSDARTVVMWDSKSANKLDLPPLVHSSEVRVVRFSTDGHFLAVGTEEGTVSLWETKNAHRVWAQRVSTHPVRGLNFANHGPELLIQTGSEWDNRRLSVLDLEHGSLIAEPIALPRVWSVDWIGQADVLATSSIDGTVRVWRPEGDQAAFALLHSSNIQCAALTNDRKLLATFDGDGICCLARPDSNEAPASTNIARFPVNILQPRAAALAPDGKMLAVADRNSGVSVFDLATTQIVARLEASAPLLTMAFTSDGRHLVTISEKGHLTAWNAATGERVEHQQLDCERGAQAATIQGTLCYVVGIQHIFVRDALKPSWTGLLLRHDQKVSACCVSADGNFILSACQDGRARVWATNNGKMVSVTPRLSTWIQSVAFSPDTARFATCADDGTVRIWWAADGRPATAPFSHGSAVTGASFSPDGRYLVTTSGDLLSTIRSSEPVVRVWDASNGGAVCCRVPSRLSGRFPMPEPGRREAWKLAATFFSAEGKTLHVVTAGGVLASLNLLANARPTEALINEIGVRSGVQPDSTGGLLVIEPEQVRSMWQSLKTGH